MSNWYYYTKNGGKVGPITAAALKALARQGLVTPETVLENEQGQSAKAGMVKGMEFPAVSNPPVPVPPITRPKTPQPATSSSPFAALNQGFSSPTPAPTSPAVHGNATTPPGHSGPIFSFQGVTGRLDVYNDKVMIVRDNSGIYGSFLSNATLRYEEIVTVKLVKACWAMRGSIYFAPPGVAVKAYESVPAGDEMNRAVVFKEPHNEQAEKIYDFVDKKLQEIHGPNYKQLPVYAWKSGLVIVWVIVAGIIGGGLVLSLLTMFD